MSATPRSSPPPAAPWRPSAPTACSATPSPPSWPGSGAWPLCATFPPLSASVSASPYAPASSICWSWRPSRRTRFRPFSASARGSTRAPGGLPLPAELRWVEVDFPPMLDYKNADPRRRHAQVPPHHPGRGRYRSGRTRRHLRRRPGTHAGHHRGPAHVPARAGHRRDGRRPMPLSTGCSMSPPPISAATSVHTASRYRMSAPRTIWKGAEILDLMGAARLDRPAPPQLQQRRPGGGSGARRQHVQRCAA